MISAPFAWRAAALALSVVSVSACDRTPEPSAPTAPPEASAAPTEAEPMPSDVPPPVEALREREQAVFGMPAPEGLDEVESTAGFARHRINAPLGLVRVFYRERLEGFREEHYSSAGTGFISHDGSNREVFLYRRPGSEVIEVTYFPNGSAAADIANRSDLAHTRVRTLDRDGNAVAVEAGGDPTEPTVRRIGPSDQPGSSPPGATAQASARPSAPGGQPGTTAPGARGGGATITGLELGGDAVERDANGNRVIRRGADAPNGGGPRTVGQSPLDFANPHFERPANPNALH